MSTKYSDTAIRWGAVVVQSISQTTQIYLALNRSFTKFNRLYEATPESIK